MRLFRFSFVVCVMAFFGGAAIGQRPTPTPVRPATTPTTASVTKVALIFSDAFENPKEGITKYVAALNGVEASFRKELDDLNAMAARIRALDKELGEIKQQAETVNPAVPVNRERLQASFSTKSGEVERLGREYKFKQEELKAGFQKKRQEVVGPILIDIGKAMQEFGKQRGFAMILDGGRLRELNAIVGLDPAADVTRDFIVFYNARTATPVTK